jgi:hypothetical protein
MRRRIHVLLLLTVLLGILAGCGEAASPTMARVGNTNITEAQFTEYMEMNKEAFDPTKSQGLSAEQVRHQMFLQLINEEVALEEARRNGYGIDAATEQGINTIIRQNTANPEQEPTFAEMDKVATNNNFASYAEVRGFLTRQFTLNSFAENVKIEGMPEQSFIREAFVPVGSPDQPGTPEEEESARQTAAAMSEQLRNGAELTDVVAKYVSDPQLSQMQGDLGWLDPTIGGPEFAAAVNALPLNQWSEPIRSSSGWHVVQITGRRTVGNWRDLMSSPQGQQFMQAKVQEYKDRGDYAVYIDPASIPTPGNVSQ